MNTIKVNILIDPSRVSRIVVGKRVLWGGGGDANRDYLVTLKCGCELLSRTWWNAIREEEPDFPLLSCARTYGFEVVWVEDEEYYGEAK